MANGLCICMCMHKCGMWACHSQKIKWTYMQHGALFSQLLLSESRQSKEVLWADGAGSDTAICLPSAREWETGLGLRSAERLYSCMWRSEPKILQSGLIRRLQPVYLLSEITDAWIIVKQHHKNTKQKKIQTTPWCPLQSTVVHNHICNLNRHQLVSKCVFLQKLDTLRLLVSKLHLLPLSPILQHEHTLYKKKHKNSVS